MPVCIAGMHRSGTSMIARMLHICGLYLGPEEELHPAQPDNPEGFWEHMRFQDINDRLLQGFGGAWDAPPALPEGWHLDPVLDPIRTEARALVAEFRPHEPWGWKDPRSSLTLPFWQTVIPDLQVLVALRNPLDVAASLTKRGYASQVFGVRLWKAYTDGMEPYLDSDRTLYTHYSAYFEDTRAELERVCSFIGLRPSESQMDEAVATVSGGLRHSESTMLDLLDSEVDTPTIRQYFLSCCEAGPIYDRYMRRESRTLAGTKREKKFRQKDDLIRETERELAIAKAHLESERAQRLKLASQLVENEQEKGRLGRRIANLEAELRSRSEMLGSVQGELESMKASGAWGLAQRLNANRYSRGMIRVLRKLRQEGPGGLARAAGRRISGGSVPSLQSPAAAVTEVAPEPTRNAPEKPVSVLQVLGIEGKTMSREEASRVLSRIASGFCLSISHDSFQAFTGGIQTLIQDEGLRLKERGTSHVHLCPVERTNVFSTEPAKLSLILSVDGAAVGLVDGNDLVEALSALVRSGKRCASVQLHHTMNWTVPLLDRLLGAVGDAPKYFWIHDYYSVCEGYNLLRNDRAFCNAPPVDSNSCMVCKYGAARPPHLANFKRFFDRWNFEFLVPSQRAAEVWLREHGDRRNHLHVTPIYSLIPTGRGIVRKEPRGRKLKVAFPGIAYEFKGWSQWRKLVDVLNGNPHYELVHLGQKTEQLQYTTFPERYERVRSGPSNPHALPDALEREQVDIVFYCPIWPETFSLIAYEAHATGCWTLTIEDSGNVAAYISKEDAGRVFPNVDLLIAYLLDVDTVATDLARFQPQHAEIRQLRFNERIVDDLYLGASQSVARVAESRA